MARSVTVTTPIPTLEEFGDALGMSKARQRSLNPIYVERRPQGGYAVRRYGAERPAKVVPTQKEGVERARAISPRATILVERVRGSRYKWRAA